MDLEKIIDRLLRFRPEERTEAPSGDAETAEGDSPSARLNLSPRELEVLHLVARGLTAPEIASTLFVSPHTVKRHMANIREKLGVRSQAAAVAALREAT